MPTATSTKKSSSARSSSSKKPAGTSAPKKKTAKIDPYDDPFAASAKPAAKASSKSSGKRKSSGTRSKKIDVQENPLGMMAADYDPYDDPWAPPAKEKTARRAPTRAKRVPDDPFDDSWAAPAPEKKAAAKSAAHAKKRKPDPFDDPWTTPTEKRKAARRNKSSGHGGSGGRKKRSGGYVTFMLSTLIVLCVLFISLQLYNYSKFINMRNAVSGSNFFAGTTIDGVDISQMTMTEAVTYWEENIEPGYYGRTVTLDNGASITAKDLGYSSDYKSVIENAWESQTSGRLADRYAALMKYSASGSGYKVSRTMYTEDSVIAYADKVASGIDSPVKEPSITGFDYNTLGFTFGEGKSGYTLDRQKLAGDIMSAMDNGGGSVVLSISVTDPRYTVDDMKNMYGLRAYAVTNASSSSENRLTNIRLALNSINGTLLQPGEEFSFNEVVGKRTRDRGYKAAPAYNSGEVVDEVGGGICQVSTTLFNAVVKSDLKVTERHNHSMPVAYVDKGKDAAVSWGAQDLRFVNNSSEPVYIVAYMDADKRVRIGVFGRLIEDGKYITVEAKVTYTKEFETVYQYNAFLLPGTMAELQAGRNTYEAMAYKCTWTADGELISREELCKSSYRGRDCIIEYGP